MISSENSVLASSALVTISTVTSTAATVLSVDTNNDAKPALSHISPSNPKCDVNLIHHVQSAIQSIKQQQQQCNIKSIYLYLKTNLSHLYPRINTLTEKDLIIQLELGVREGILSRKYSGNCTPTSTGSSSNSTSPNRSPTSISSLSCLTSMHNIPTYIIPKINYNNLTTTTVNNIKKQTLVLNQSERQHLNLILQLLIKSVASLNNQNFHDIQSKSNNEIIDPVNQNPSQTCSINIICKYLLDKFKFRIEELRDPASGDFDRNINQTQSELFDELRPCVRYLMSKNEKMFIKTEIESANDDDNKYSYKLNSQYINQKLRQNLKSPPPVKVKPTTTTSTTTTTAPQISPKTEKLDTIKTEQKPLIIETNNLESSVAPEEVTVELVEKLLGIRPPYSAEQILKIESLKKPPISSPDSSKYCSFCLQTEDSNPLGRYDRFLSCCDCGSNGHSYCLKYSTSVVDHIRSHNIKWQCLECKKCSVCLSTSETMLLCDRCDRSYHKECCKPPFIKRPKNQFICHVCREVILKEEPLVSNQNNLASVQQVKENKKRKLFNTKKECRHKREW